MVPLRDVIYIIQKLRTTTFRRATFCNNSDLKYSQSVHCAARGGKLKESAFPITLIIVYESNSSFVWVSNERLSITSVVYHTSCYRFDKIGQTRIYYRKLWIIRYHMKTHIVVSQGFCAQRTSCSDFLLLLVHLPDNTSHLKFLNTVITKCVTTLI